MNSIIEWGSRSALRGLTIIALALVIIASVLNLDRRLRGGVPMVIGGIVVDTPVVEPGGILKVRLLDVEKRRICPVILTPLVMMPGAYRMSLRLEAATLAVGRYADLRWAYELPQRAEPGRWRFVLHGAYECGDHTYDVYTQEVAFEVAERDPANPMPLGHE